MKYGQAREKEVRVLHLLILWRGRSGSLGSGKQDIIGFFVSFHRRTRERYIAGVLLARMNWTV